MEVSPISFRSVLSLPRGGRSAPSPTCPCGGRRHLCHDLCDNLSMDFAAILICLSRPCRRPLFIAKNFLRRILQLHRLGVPLLDSINITVLPHNCWPPPGAFRCSLLCAPATTLRLWSVNTSTAYTVSTSYLFCPSSGWLTLLRFSDVPPLEPHILDCSPLFSIICPPLSQMCPLEPCLQSGTNVTCV